MEIISREMKAKRSKPDRLTVSKRNHVLEACGLARTEDYNCLSFVTDQELLFKSLIPLVILFSFRPSVWFLSSGASILNQRVKKQTGFGLVLNLTKSCLVFSHGNQTKSKPLYFSNIKTKPKPNKLI